MSVKEFRRDDARRIASDILSSLSESRDKSVISSLQAQADTAAFRLSVAQVLLDVGASVESSVCLECGLVRPGGMNYCPDCEVNTNA